MTTRTLTRPPTRSLARELVEAFFGIFVGVVLQIVRVVLLAIQKFKRAATQRKLRQKAISMGVVMERKGVGDQIILQKIRTISPDDKTRAKERAVWLAKLGELWLEPDVPPFDSELEDPYRDGRQAYMDARVADVRHNELAAAVWPRNAIGWASLIASYVFTISLVIYLSTYLAKRPDRVPVGGPPLNRPR